MIRRHRASGRIALVVTLVFGVTASASAQGPPTAGDAVWFHALQAELRRAQAELERTRLRVYAKNPMLPIAIAKLKEARQLDDDGTQPRICVARYLRKNNPDRPGLMAAHANLEGAVREMMDDTMIREWLRDPLCRPIIRAFIGFYAERRHGSELAGASTDRKVAVTLAHSKRQREASARKYQAIQSEWRFPPFVIAQAWDEARYSHLVSLWDIYVRQHTPEELRDAERAVHDVYVQMGTLWPTWGEAERIARAPAQ